MEPTNVEKAALRRRQIAKVRDALKILRNRIVRVARTKEENSIFEQAPVLF